MKNNVKVIFHIDMNAFYTSCEQIDQPKLRNKPIAISGKNAIYNKGVVVTASYEARKFGVKSAMPVFKAKELCPHLLLVQSRRHLYKEYSKKFIRLLKEYTQSIEVASIDEAYLDVTSYLKTKHPIKLAEEIQTRLKQEIGLPSSIGIAPNKFLAKMASDMKKPMGITVLRKREIKEKLWPLKIGDMYGIGKKTAPKLVEAGIQTIGDLVKKENQTHVIKILGNQYQHFYQNAMGNGNDHVDPSKNDSYKSIGHSSTFNASILKEEDAYTQLKSLTNMVVDRLHKHRYLVKTITVQIRLEDFNTYSKSETIVTYTDAFETIYEKVITLFDSLWAREPIRLLGVSTSNLIDREDYKEEITLFNYQEQLQDEGLIKTIHQLNRKFGDDVIKKGTKFKNE